LTSEPHSAVEGLDGSLTVESGDFGPDNGVLLFRDVTDSPTPELHQGSLTVLAPDGTVLTGEIYNGVSLFGQPGSCTYGGTFTLSQGP
jgi:hypothetical protein